MNKENLQYLIQTAGSEANDVGSYISDLGDMELERCSSRRPGKLESKLGNFREKIKKGRKPQSF
ncbi:MULTISPECIES: hypothetical protein [Methylomonas]|uniref:Uncharacterized protein n=2 Tax=Methylomonas TaxID=416 RepID=A0A126T8Z2_9GAMM|nr:MULTISPECIES: hypothetical protein [Methylomonas]AMK78555.1 hypothetical protein JT25_019010 [Methylomonas denitrificans]OAI06465.1 hypothetical protein A1342_06530 [Methylomonas methanica]TCV77389.1 hypothetical protein EDE11_12914 [Methylomonas methanica]